MYLIFDPQTITNAFVTLLWEVAVCILMCIERGDGACLLRATMALACLVPWQWRHLKGITMETVPVLSK